MKSIQNLSAIVIITIIMGLIYVSVQQSYRTSANDPQIQLSHDLVNRLERAKSIESWFPADTLDLKLTKSVFIETFDISGHPIRSTAYLNGKLPQLPQGVLNFAREKGEDWVTWQPEKDVRMAMGILRVNTGPVAIVAVGRSLQDTEERVSKLTTMVIICWVLCIGIVLINWLGQHYFPKQNKSVMGPTK